MATTTTMVTTLTLPGISPSRSTDEMMLCAPSIGPDEKYAFAIVVPLLAAVAVHGAVLLARERG